MMPKVISDAARRCSEAITQAALLGYEGWWVAIRLSDGGTICDPSPR